MTTVLFQLKRLEDLQAKCGGKAAAANAEPQVDTSKMTEYERKQYTIATNMQKIRTSIADLDNLGPGASATHKAMLKNRIYKDIDAMKRDTQEAKRLAGSEKRKADYEKLVQHVRRTEQLYRGRFGGGGGGDDEEGGNINGSPSRSRDIRNFDEELSAPLHSIGDDAEFQQFFEQTRQNDVKIDQALDHLTVGVTKLHQSAIAINTELKVHQQLMTEMEDKMDNVTGSLVQINKKLKKAIKEVQKDKLCLYLVLCIVLLGLAGAIYFVVKGN
jgi:hypothetical protein